MEANLTAGELAQLVARVFLPGPGERGLAVLVDLPDAAAPDTPAWRERREMAAHWVEALSRAPDAALQAVLYLYRNVRRANADLPSTVYRHAGGPLPATAEALEGLPSRPLVDVLRTTPMVLAPTEFSATAPLKILAPALGFRGATMPGFTPAMIPALRLDLTEVSRRVAVLAALLDRAVGADIDFRVDGSQIGRASCRERG